MNLGEKIQYVIDNYEDGDKVAISYTTSTDNHSEVYVFINNNAEFMSNYLEDYQKYGVVEGCDPKGIWLKYINFKLLK